MKLQTLVIASCAHLTSWKTSLARVPISTDPTIHPATGMDASTAILSSLCEIRLSMWAICFASALTSSAKHLIPFATIWAARAISSSIPATAPIAMAKLSALLLTQSVMRSNRPSVFFASSVKALPVFSHAAAAHSTRFQSPAKGLNTTSSNTENPKSFSHTQSTLPRISPASQRRFSASSEVALGSLRAA